MIPGFLPFSYRQQAIELSPIVTKNSEPYRTTNTTGKVERMTRFKSDFIFSNRDQVERRYMRMLLWFVSPIAICHIYSRFLP